MNFLSSCLKILPSKVRNHLYNTLIYKKGKFGIGLRYIVLKSLAKHCGDNVAIFPNVYLFAIERLDVGNNVSIHEFSYIDSTGEIEIGNDVSIAHSTTIMSSSHNFEDLNIAIKDQGMSYSKTIIKSNVWIGAKSTIISGITINSGTVIGAHSVVTKTTVENGVYVGNPSQLIRMRGVK